MYDTLEHLIGETVQRILLDKRKSAIRFECLSGKTVNYSCDGDCCSFSWIEHMEGVSALIGAKVIGYESVDIDHVLPTGEYGGGSVKDEHGESHDCLQFYGYKLMTVWGHFLMEMRNSSNGYYGGSLDYREHLNIEDPTTITEDF